MMKAYLGIDIGSISTKGVGPRRRKTTFWPGNTFGPRATRWGRSNGCSPPSESQLTGAEVVSVGTTGSARKLIGVITGAAVVKNEITAHAVGHPLPAPGRAHGL